MSAEDSRAGWWMRRGVRLRSALAAVGIVAVTFLIVSTAMVGVVRIALTNAAETAVAQRARDAAAQITSDDTDALSAMTSASPDDETVVQVIGPGGRVLLASPALAGEPAIATQEAADGVVVREVAPAALGREPYAVAATRAHSAQGAVVVVAAQSLAPRDRTTLLVVVGLLIVAPILLGAVGSTTWLLVGRSLASVDRIRRRVDDIGASDLHQRVPVPPADDEIADLARTMNSMLSRLEEAMARQREFVADASHELKTPLASLRATLDVAGTELTEKDRVVLSFEVDRMRTLVGDLLTLARSDDHAPHRAAEIDLDDLIRGVVAPFTDGPHDVAINVDAQPVKTYGDAGFLARAIRNLVANAIRHAATRVLVTVRDDHGPVVFVDDDGPGIPASERQRVFQRFVRLDEHRSREDGGTGLGLAIVDAAARASGGTATAGDSPLGGARMTLRLPPFDQSGAAPTASSR